MTIHALPTSIVDARRAAVEDASRVSAPDLMMQRYAAVLRCTKGGHELRPSDKHVMTSLRFAASAFEPLATIKLAIKSAFEPLATIKLAIKVDSVLLAGYFTTGVHYLLQLRDTARDSYGDPIPTKLDEELAALLVRCTFAGGVEVNDEGDDRSVIKFEADGLKLEVRFEDAGALAKAFVRRQDLRLVLASVPAWVEEFDRQRIADQAKRDQEREDARQARATGRVPGQLPMGFEEESIKEEE